MIEQGRWRMLDEAATRIYVETRIALIDYPNIRVRTENIAARRSVIVWVWGWHSPDRFTTWGVDGGMEFWLEDIFTRDDAERCGAIVRWKIEREFEDLLRRGRRFDTVTVEEGVR